MEGGLLLNCAASSFALLIRKPDASLSMLVASVVLDLPRFCWPMSEVSLVLMTAMPLLFSMKVMLINGFHSKNFRKN